MMVIVDMEVIWTQVWKHTGIELDSLALPTTAVCPFCQIKSIYISPQVDSQTPPWCMCSNCGHSDDLLATVGKTAFSSIKDPVEAVAHLLGDRDMRRWATDTIERTRRWQIWDKLRERSFFWVERYPAARYLAEALRIYRNPESWKAGIGQLIAVTPKRKVEAAIQGEDIDSLDGSVEFVAVWPMERRPGWIHGWMSASIDKAGKPHLSRLNKQPIGARTGTTCWLGMNEVIRAETEAAVYLWNRPFGTFRWHETACRFDGKPAPILSLHGTEKRPVKVDRADFVNREPVILAADFDPILLALMIDLDARWAPIGGILQDRTAPTHLDSLWFLDRCMHLNKTLSGQHRDWSEYVRAAIRRLDELQLKKFFDRAELSDHQYEEVERRVETLPAIVRRKTRIVPTRAPILSVTEQDNQWMTPRGEIVSEATLVVDEIRVYPKSARIAAIGKIRWRDREVPFHEDTDIIEKRGFEWLRELLATAGVPYVGAHPRFKASLWKLAMSFSSPQRTVGADWPGWCHEINGFCLPDVTLKVVGSRPACLRPIYRMRMSLRCSDPAVELLQMLQTKSIEPLNVLVPIMLEYIFSAARGTTPIGTLICCNAEKRKRMIDVALALGCLEEETPTWPLVKIAGEGIYIGVGATETAKVHWVPELHRTELLSLNSIIPACLQLWLKNTAMDGKRTWNEFKRRLT